MSALPARVQTEDKSFVRDTHSKGLLCTDVNALTRHRRRLEEVTNRAALVQRFEALDEKVNLLTDQVRRLVAQLCKNE